MSEVILKIIEGGLLGDEFVFEDKGLYLVGRSRHCALQIPNEKDMRISRRHLLLILDPPYARIRDLGSRNGTIVNGEVLEPGKISDEPEKMTPVDRILKSGDIVSFGDTALTVLVPSEAPVHISPKQEVSKVMSVVQTSVPEKTQLGPVTQKFAPVTHVALPDSAKALPPVILKKPEPPKEKQPPVTHVEPPDSAKTPPPVDPQTPAVESSKPEPVTAVNKLKIKDVNVDKYEQIKAKVLQQTLDSNLPTVEMEVQEFEDMDDLVFQPDHESVEKPKKRVTKFKIKGPT